MIQTERCELTPLRAEDLEAVVRLYADLQVRRFLGGPVPTELTRSKFPKLLADRTTRRWVVRSREGHVFMGILSLGPHHDGVDTEVAYQFLTEWWGQGYAQETVGAVIRHALRELGLPRVIAETQTANSASCRLLEGLGMHVERTVERFGAEQAIYVMDAVSEGPPKQVVK